MKKMTYWMGVWMAMVVVACGPSYDQTVDIGTIGNQMKYDTNRIQASPGDTIKINLKNNATMPIMKHNLVILSSQDAIEDIGAAAVKSPNYVPSDTRILAASDLLGPGESTSLVVTVPSEPGTYPYICTFPGHYQVMQGVIIVK